MKKVTIITGSVIIGLVSLLSVIFVLVGGDQLGGSGTGLVFKSADATSVYDGSPLTAAQWELEEGSLKKGHVAQVTVTGSQTDAGVGENTFSVVIVNDSGKDVTDQYEIECRPGKLTVNQRRLELVADSLYKIYDGTPLVGEGYTVNDGELVAGHIIEDSYIGSITAVGSTSSTMSVKIIDAKGADVTKNYELICHTGDLTVTKRPITLKSATVERIYNGIPLVSDSVSIVSGSIAAEQRLTTNVSGRVTSVGQAKNTFTASISDSSGNDVSENYDITYVYGDLIVSQSRITVYTGSDVKTYDGTPLVCDEWGIISGTIATGERVNVEFQNTITNVGVVTNGATFTVTNSAGEDTTKNYVFTVVTGKVEILERGVIITSGSDIKVYDGTPLTKQEITILDETPLSEGHTIETVFTGMQLGVGESENTYQVIIRDEYGNDVTDNYAPTFNYGKLTVTERVVSVQSPDALKVYDGITLTSTLDEFKYTGELAEGHRYDIQITGSQTNAGESDNTFIVRVLDANGVDVTANYKIDSIMGKLAVLQRPVGVYSPSSIKIYDGTALTTGLDELTYIGDLAPDQTYDIRMTGTQTDVGTSDNTFEIKILDAAGVDVTENYVVQINYGELTVTEKEIGLQSQNRFKKYDGKPLEGSPDDITYVGELVLGHTYDIKMTGSQTNVGVCSNSFDVRILDEQGIDVTNNYNIDKLEGTLEVITVYINASSKSKSKPYDGKPLEGLIEDVTVDETLADGHTYEIQMLNSQTDAGSCINAFNLFIYDENMQDVTHNYTVRYSTGYLTVTAIDLTFTSSGASKVYDGTPLTGNADNVTFAGDLVDNHTFKITMTGSQTDAGNSQDSFTVDIYDENGVNVTRNYNITTKCGYLNVYPIQMTISSIDKSAIYNGNALTGSIDDISILEGSLIDGHEIKFAINGSIVDAGSISNDFSVEITDKDGKNVIYNYEIDIEAGNLTITPRPYTIISPTVDTVYDGKVRYTLSEQCIQEGELVDGDECIITMSAQRIEVGEVENEFDVIFVRDGEDISRNYDLVKSVGKITIHKRPLAVTTPGKTETYNGVPLTSPGMSLSEGTTLVDGHTIENVMFPSSITDIGKVDNEVYFEIHNGDEDVTHNYDIQKYLGMLVVTPFNATYSSGSAEKKYDGTPLTDDTWELQYPESLPDGHVSVVTVFGERTEVGESDNGFAVDIFNAEGKSVINNFVIRYVPGKLVVYDDSDGGGSGGDGTGGEGGEGGNELELDGGLGGGGGKPQKPKVVLTVKSDVAGKLYMRIMSYGDYNMHGFDRITDYPRLLDDKYSYNYLSGEALKNNGYEPHYLEVKNESTQYSLPPYMAMKDGDYNIPQGDTSYDQSHGGEYSLYYYTYTGMGTELSATLGNYTEEEIAYRSFVYNNYLKIDPETENFMDDIIRERGLDKNDPQIISKVCALIQNSAQYNLDYDIAMDDEGNIVVAFLGDYQEGVCRHFAASATLLYRALGIPARYVVGWSGSTTANKWTQIMSDRGHAWVEVYIDGIGWITVDPTPAGYNDDDKTEPTDDVTEETTTEMNSDGTEEGSDGKPEGGLSDDLRGSPGKPEGKLVMRIMSEVSGHVYLRCYSSGNYNMYGFDEEPKYGSLLDGVYPYTYLFGETLKNNGYNPVLLQIQNITNDYALPSDIAMNQADYTIPTSEMYHNIPHDGEYSAMYYLYSGIGIDLTSNIGQYADEELIYREFVKQNYVYIDSDTKAYMDQIIAENNLDPSDPYIISKVSEIIKSSAKYSYDFDEEMNDADNMVVAFLRDYKVGVCRHFAASATMLYRALGIPARFTQGLSASTVAGEWNDVMSDQYHAWVEVYVDGMGWVTVDPTPPSSDEEETTDGETTDEETTDEETTEPLKEKLTVKPVTEYMEYDGVSVLTHSGNLQGLTELTKKGYTYKAVISGSGREVGRYTATIEELHIFDPGGTEVTDQFKIDYKTGVLHVYIYEITIATQNASKTYDGSELVCKEYRILSNANLEDFVINVECKGSQTKVGTSSNNCTVTITDHAGNDMSYQFKINKINGQLEVKPKNLIIQAGSDAKVYDGTPLECPTWEFGEETALLEGHTIDVTVSGTLTNVGRSSNKVVSVRIYDENGEEVTRNYSITTKNGRLQVLPPKE